MSVLSAAERVLESYVRKDDAPQEMTFAQMKEQKDQLEQQLVKQADKVARELMVTRDMLNTERMLKANAERNAVFYREQYNQQLAINRKLAAYAHKVDTRLNVIAETIEAAQHEAKDFSLDDIVKQLTAEPDKNEVDMEAGVKDVVAGIVKANPRPGETQEEQSTKLPPNEFTPSNHATTLRPLHTTPEPPMNLGLGADFRRSDR